MTFFTQVIQDFVDGSLRLSSLLVLLSVLGVVYLALTNKYGYGLNHVPGPWQARYSNLYRLQRTLTGTSHTHDSDMHRKYGSLVRLGPEYGVCWGP
jgi:hypothetical protein